VLSVRVTSPLRGDVVLAAGSGVTITQSGKTITISSSGGGGSVVSNFDFWYRGRPVA
jgi:hypothetical protein